MRDLRALLAAWGIILVLVLLCGGCGDSRTSVMPESAVVPPGGLLAALPPLPSGRVTNALEDLVRTGIETMDRSANAVDSGTTLVLNAGAGALEWGIWGWDATDAGLVGVAFNVDVPAGSEIYFALANYAESRWELHGPYTTNTQFPLDDATYKSAAEGVYVAALAYDSVAPQCVNVTLTVDSGADQPPQAGLFADPTSGEAPLMVDFDASSSFDDGTIVDYEWDLDGNGTFNEAGPETDARGSFFATYTYNDVGDYTAQVRVTDDGAQTDTAEAVISVAAANLPPVADLQADPLSGPAPLNVLLDGTASYDPEGELFILHWDFDDDGIFNEPGLEQEKENYGLFGYTFFAASVYDITMRATDIHGDADYATVQITVTGNQAPVADLQADQTGGDPPLMVNYSAAGSSDPDGSIVDFEWDLDADKEFSETGAEADARGLNTAQFTYDAAGAYGATVRVTDDDGATDEASWTVVVHGWVIVTVASGSENFVGTSLKEIDGRPAISYGLSSDAAMAYAYSATPYGTSAQEWQNFEVDSSASTWTTSLQVVDGNPAIAYENSTKANLMYARSSTPGGQSLSDWSIVTIESDGETGRSPSLAVIDGRPAIAYSRGSIDSSELMYALSTTATGGSAADWDCIPLLTCVGEVWNSLALIDGKPAIAYYEDGNSALQYAYASTADGGAAADWDSFILDGSLLWCGEWCSLAEVAGVPAIAYHGGDDASEFLRFAVSSTAQGANAADWTKLTVDSDSGYSGTYNSVAEVGGKPGIAYYDGGMGVLKYANSSTASGDAPADWSCEVVDSLIISGEEASLAEIHGCPAISYYYDGMFMGELRYAILLQ